MKIFVVHDFSKVHAQLEDIREGLIWIKGYILSRNISNGLQI